MDFIGHVPLAVPDLHIYLLCSVAAVIQALGEASGRVGEKHMRLMTAVDQAMQVRRPAS
jgi:hypothetical protein